MEAFLSTLFSNVCVCFLHFGGKMRFAGDGTVRVIHFFRRGLPIVYHGNVF